jgi:hypothetical protein
MPKILVDANGSSRGLPWTAYWRSRMDARRSRSSDRKLALLQSRLDAVTVRMPEEDRLIIGPHLIWSVRAVHAGVGSREPGESADDFGIDLGRDQPSQYPDPYRDCMGRAERDQVTINLLGMKDTPAWHRRLDALLAHEFGHELDRILAKEDPGRRRRLVRQYYEYRRRRHASLPPDSPIRKARDRRARRPGAGSCKAFAEGFADFVAVIWGYENEINQLNAFLGLRWL